MTGVVYVDGPCLACHCFRVPHLVSYLTRGQVEVKCTRCTHVRVRDERVYAVAYRGGPSAG